LTTTDGVCDESDEEDQTDDSYYTEYTSDSRLNLKKTILKKVLGADQNRREKWSVSGGRRRDTYELLVVLLTAAAVGTLLGVSDMKVVKTSVVTAGILVDNVATLDTLVGGVVVSAQALKLSRSQDLKSQGQTGRLGRVGTFKSCT
jgi:hypothetical protein